MAKLELYHMESCPFCRKVRGYIEKNGLKSQITYHDINQDPAAAERLEALNGDDQVPCLTVDGKPMLESEEIIEWLDENLKQKVG